MKMQKIAKKEKLFIVFTGLFFTSVGLVYNGLCNWDRTFTDVSVQKYFASNIQWLEPASYAFPFYPSLWPVIIKIIGVNNWDYFYLIINPIILGLVIISVFLLLIKLGGDFFWSFALVMILGLNGFFIRPYLNGLSDGTFALVWVWAIYASLVRKRWLIFGILIGCMSLMRHHGLLFGLMSLIFIVLPQKSIRATLLFMAGAALTYAPQLIIDVSAGNFPFQTEQGFNIYKTFWSDIATEELAMPEDLIHKVLEHPTRVWYRYTARMLNYWVTFFLPILVFCWSFYHKKTLVKNVALFALFTIAISSFGWSPHILPPYWILLVTLVLLASNHVKNYLNKKIIKLIFIILIIKKGFDVSLSLLSTQEHNIANSLNQQKLSTYFIKNNIKNYNKILIEDHGFSLGKYMEGNIPYLFQQHWLRYNNDEYNRKYPSITSEEIIQNPDSMKHFVLKHLDAIVISIRDSSDAKIDLLANVPYLVKCLSVHELRYNYYFFKKKEVGQYRQFIAYQVLDNHRESPVE